MRAVWSFWSKPFRADRGSRWLSDYHAWLAWGLSVKLARRHYPDTTLVTDDDGAAFLVDRLKLPFERISLELNRLHDHDPDRWALGKLYAYRLQAEPFVHIDSDVFLWKRLPAELESAPVFAQSPEEFDPGRAGDYPVPGAGWLPDAWRWYSARPAPLFASCCGIVGGTRTDVLREFAEQGVRVLESLEHANARVERFLLNAVVEYRRDLEWIAEDGTLRVAYLFPTEAAAFDPAQAEAVGYTHLIGAAKRNPELMADLDARMCADYPEIAERCRSLAPH